MVDSSSAGVSTRNMILRYSGARNSDFALFVILGEDFGRRRRYVAGVSAVEQDVFDRALLVLIAIEGFDKVFGERQCRR